jgi:hypothetical protein
LEDDREVHRHQDQVIHRETPEENETTSLIQISTSNPFQTNKWLAKKMQLRQPDIRKEIDRHRTIIRE